MNRELFTSAYWQNLRQEVERRHTDNHLREHAYAHRYQVELGWCAWLCECCVAGAIRGC